jgi:hypothetical protein
MGLALFNPNPDDPVSWEAASLARGLVKAYLDGGGDFLVLAFRDAQSFFMLEHETKATLDEMTNAEALAEVGRRTSALAAASAALAAMAIDAALPRDDPEVRALRMANFFEDVQGCTY